MQRNLESFVIFSKQHHVLLTFSYWYECNPKVFNIGENEVFFFLSLPFPLFLFSRKKEKLSLLQRTVEKRMLRK